MLSNGTPQGGVEGIGPWKGPGRETRAHAGFMVNGRTTACALLHGAPHHGVPDLDVRFPGLCQTR